MKNPHAVALGRLGGLVGGKAKTPAKAAANKRNVQKRWAAVRAQKKVEPTPKPEA